MKKIVRLTESDLVNLVKRVISEQGSVVDKNSSVNRMPMAPKDKTKIFSMLKNLLKPYGYTDTVQVEVTTGDMGIMMAPTPTRVFCLYSPTTNKFIFYPYVIPSKTTFQKGGTNYATVFNMDEKGNLYKRDFSSEQFLVGLMDTNFIGVYQLSNREAPKPEKYAPISVKNKEPERINLEPKSKDELYIFLNGVPKFLNPVGNGKYSVNDFNKVIELAK